MFKWVVGLCAIMYLALVTIGEPTKEELAERKLRDEQIAARTVKPTPAPPVILQTSANAAPVEATPAVADASATAEITTPLLVSATTGATAPAEAEPVTTQAIAPAPTNTSIRRVTGKRVNLRAGPSTTSEIVGRAVRDDSAEVVELLPSGWAKVYILETGIEAYISSQFLSDAG
ncbi:SH3 domain-containing protein [uncultured Litoreibacter sp.]|uniref:SH3 domain-containing protein n=1 Tax=uncultured Litoreibacter sp. TaxID=1392394 RepID=UPI00263779A8|nr:SH3 domain-containing protein [uncultured Litoreibacter sp.]